MTTPPTVSVVVPAFNVEHVVGRALGSVVRQEMSPFDIVVVDDGSTDRTGEIARGFDGVRVVRQDNKGLSGARNAGAAVATGTHLLFLDADDELLPGAIEALIEHLARQPGVGAIVPNFIRRSDEGDSVAWPWLDTARLLGRSDVGSLMKRLWLSTNALISRFAWERHPFDETLRATPDLDLWLGLLLEEIPVLIVPELAVRAWVSRAESISRSVVTMRRERRVVFEKLSRRDDLTAAEKALVSYQLVRLTMGEASARAATEGPAHALAELEASRNSVVRGVVRFLRFPGALTALARVDKARSGRRPQIGDM